MNFPGKFDQHILPKKIHSINVSFGITKLEQRFGGTAGNIVYTLGLLGEQPYLISQVGNDFTEYKAWLREVGVRLTTVRSIKAETMPTAHIMTDMNDNQITGFYFGAMFHSAMEDQAIMKRVTKLAKQQSTIGIISPGNADDMVALAKLYQQHGTRYLFDPGQQISWLTKAQLNIMLKGAAIVIVNDYELAMLTKKTGQSLTALKAKLDMLIVTLGSEGSTWYVRSGKQMKKHTMPIAQPKKVVDPTGAGDAYRAGLLKGLVDGLDIETTARLAALCATYAVEQYGTQQHTFTTVGFKRRFSKEFGKDFLKQLHI